MMTLGPNPTNINPQASPWGYAPTFQASSSTPLVQEQQPRPIVSDDILNMSVDEILSSYKHDTGLLKHILAVKAQDDQRKTADELRQLDKARQKFGYDDGFHTNGDYIDATYTMQPNKSSVTIDNVSPAYNNMNNASPIFSESSLQTSQHYDPQDLSANFDLLLSPPLPATMMMDHSMNFFPVTSHQPQEQASSVPISMDLPLVPSASTTHNLNFDNPVASSSLSPPFTGQFMSPSPLADYTIPDVFSTISSSSSVGSNSLVADLSTTTRPVSCSPSMENNLLPPDTRNSHSDHASSETKRKPSTGKHKRRHLSTTSLPGFSSSTHVIRWAATKKKRTSRPVVNINQEPQEPLDHKKVMEALRNKLNRTQTSSLSPTSTSSLDITTSPPPPKTTPPTSPRSPVDTQPSTSVLYLDLKSNPSLRHRNYRHQ